MEPQNCGADGPIDRCGVVGAAQEMIGEAAESGKRKRGRPPRGQVRAAPAPAKKKAEVEEEEDVCFICFDGGSLVLCDRRGCPKAYHSACVKRDEAFFQSKAKWNCGWHICSSCQKKASHYMCYTCTYSLCKACAKDTDYLSVRENKGFCVTCMKTIMMIENNFPENKETVKVDFDDKSSWEYLFKVYWIYLKGKLSLTLDELTQAKSPDKAAVTIAPKERQLDVLCGSRECKSAISDIPSGNLVVTDFKRRRTKEQLFSPSTEDCQSTDKSSSDKSTISSGSTEWATKELLEFVAHMKNGDVSVLSQFDVQGLLLEYIKRNNLRDPRRKSQIICDSRLMTLFVKPRVGHFEMLKLLEYHFLIKEDNQKEENILGITARAVPSQMEGGGNNESLLISDKVKKRKNRRKDEESGPQTNLDEFAAIDVHNINLIYLRRSLMENLFKDNVKFHDKVVGSIVRIRISSGDPKQDMYRLVQVVGTFKAAFPYKVGEKTVDVMLEILNLNKKETVAIDAISNQEFSEDECRRLRQSIKCGLVKRMTVGQVQEKARALQEVRLNDWLETEMLRLKHLRDRASEKGRKKELRQCVEKIELLQTPEERLRRLVEHLQVHADPKMDPKCESDEDVGEVNIKKQADHVKQRYSGFRKYDREPISPQNKTKLTKFNLDKGPISRFGEKVHELPKRKDADLSETRIFSPSTGSTPSASNSETEKLWHYRDPNGKIQGPFCIVQLRKWSTTGYFPHDMRVWSISNDEVDSLLLTDVLNGNFLKLLPLRSNVSLSYQDKIEDRHSSSVNPTIVNDGKRSNGSLNCSSATSVHQVAIHEDRRRNLGANNGNLSSHGHKNESATQPFSGQSSIESWQPLAVSVASNNSVSNSNLVSVAKSTDTSDRLRVDTLNLPSPTPMASDLEELKTKEQKSSKPCGLIQDSDIKELPSPTRQASERNAKTDLSIESLPSPTLKKVDLDVKVNSNIQNLSSSPPNARDKDEKVHDNESKPPNASCICDSITPEPIDQDEKADMDIQNIPNPSPKMVNGDEEVDSAIQNSPSSPLNSRDRDEEVQGNESKPPGSSNTCNSSTIEPKDRDEKADICIQEIPSPLLKEVDVDKKVDLNIPSLPEKTDVGIQNIPSLSSETVDEDAKVDNLPSSGHKPRNKDAKVQVSHSKQFCHSSTHMPSDSDEKADGGVLNLPSFPLKTVDEDEKIGSDMQNLQSSIRNPRDRDENIQASDSKEPGACSSPMPSNSDEKTDMGNQKPPSPSLKAADEDGKVSLIIQSSPISSPNTIDKSEKNEIKESKLPGAYWTSTSSLVEGGGTPLGKIADEWVGFSPARTKPPEVDQAATPASEYDQIASPLASNPPPSASNWKAFDYEPIEFSTLAEESVSDLLAEVDAMGAQGDVASPTSMMFSGDEFFEDYKGDYFVSLGGLGHSFNLGKNDDLSSTGDSSSPHQCIVISEPLGPTQNDVFDSISRSERETSTSIDFGLETRHTSSSASQMENGPNRQIPFEQRPTDRSLGIMEGNMNPGYKGLTQGMPSLGWEPKPGLVQGNVDMNGSTFFGFMGHERHRGPNDVENF